MRSLVRNLSALIVLGALVASCAPTQEAAPPPPPIVAMAAPPPTEALWPEGTIPMCFVDLSPETAWAREAVRQAAHTWESAAAVTFHFEDGCYRGGAVPIRLVGDPTLFAQTTDRGQSLQDGGEMVLNTGYSRRDPICGGTEDKRFRCFRADALHELGHALGFAHDTASVGAPVCRASQRAPETVDDTEVYYDAQSIMNYCNPGRWNGRLSDADVCSVQVAYGSPFGQRPTRAQCYALAASARPSA